MGQGRDLGSPRQRLFPGLSLSAYVCMYVPVYIVCFCLWRPENSSECCFSGSIYLVSFLRQVLSLAWNSSSRVRLVPVPVLPHLGWFWFRSGN